MSPLRAVVRQLTEKAVQSRRKPRRARPTKGASISFPLVGNPSWPNKMPTAISVLIPIPRLMTPTSTGRSVTVSSMPLQADCTTISIPAKTATGESSHSS